ncbi:MAG: flagellar biosynthesis anti-sigma factor FlgM [Deltaproteobacteria bacterium]|nr:flagellar biosynthesis anti-sigma factor FlgM [Deltaproteobacteria bacterium]
MAPSKTQRARHVQNAAPPSAPADVVARQVRVEELRRLVAQGAYKVEPQRLALRILVRSLGNYSPEKRT